MALVKVFVFVVLGVAQAVTKQEKIKPNYFSDSDSVFKYSSAFAFDPFTPFPELLSTTPRPELLSTTPTPKLLSPTSRQRPNSIARRTKQSKSEISDTSNHNAETTTATITTTKTKLLNKKVIILRKKKISKNAKKNGKNGYRVISDIIESKKAKIRSKTDTNEWVQSILSRTTRKPTTTTTTTTTPAPTLSTTPAPVLTRELQLQLQKMLARRNLPEQSRSSSLPQYFKTQQFSDNKIQTEEKISFQPANFPSQQFPTQHKSTHQQQFTSQQQFIPQQQFTPKQQFIPQQQYTPREQFAPQQKFTPHQQYTARQKFTPQQKFVPQQRFATQQQFTSSQQVSASHQQPLQKKIFNPQQLLDFPHTTAPRQKAVPEQNFIQTQQPSVINGYKKAILSQQQSHQAFLQKNRFRLKTHNSQHQQYGQQHYFPNQISPPLQQQGYHGQLSQQQYYNTQQSEQQSLNQRTPQQQQFQLG